MLYTVSRLILKFGLYGLFRFRVHGEVNYPEPPFIIASNHASYLDPPIVGVSCRKYPVDFMAKTELFSTPVGGVWSRGVKCIPVDRDKSGASSLKEAIRRLKNGRVVAIFPEGTRSQDGEMQEAKRGTGFLVSRSGVPVVPVYIHGSGKAFARRGKIKIGSKIDVYIGKPVFFKPGDKDYGGISDKIMEHIAGLRKIVETEGETG